MRVGDVIEGRYEVVRLSRTGATGMVFEAVDRRSTRPVAVKLINTRGHDAGLVSRIQREVDILQALSHPHVVACYGSGRVEDDKLYLILEWLEGADLSEHKLEHPTTLREALDIGRQAADALAAAHGREIVHRDIKPANIFLVRPQAGVAPDVRVLDFGVAKHAEDQQALTFAGAILGTPCYMAPEQASYAMSVDGRADVFSLGVVLFELITGQLPWASSSDLARLARILIEPAKKLAEAVPDIPEPVAAVIDAMLAHRAQDRPETMREAHARLVDCLETLPASVLDRCFSLDPKHRAKIAASRTAPLDSAAVVAGRSSLWDEGPLDDNETHDYEDPPLEKTQLISSVRVGGSASPVPAPSTVGPAPIPDVPTIGEAQPSDDRTVGFDASQLPTRALVGVRLPPAQEAGGVLPEPVRGVRPRSAGVRVAGVAPPSEPARRPTGARRTGELDPSLSYVAQRERLPLLGRDALLDSLIGRVDEALEHAIPSRTLIVGPAGIGKTRVRAEVTRRIQRRRDGPALLAGRAEERTRSTPYAFLRRMLLAEARVFADDPPEVKEAKLAGLLPPEEGDARLRGRGDDAPSEERTRFVQADEWTERPSVVAAMSDAFELGPGERSAARDERAALVSYLADALQVSIPTVAPIWAARRDPRLMAVETRRSLDLVLRRLAGERGLVILVDDGHFLDPLAAEVLAGLTRPERSLPIAVVVFAQPTMLDTDAFGGNPLAGPGAKVVDIGPLDGKVARRLADEVAAGPIRGDAREVLIQRADGNPLYLEQLVRAVKETNVLAREGNGPYVLTGLRGDSRDFERVPPTVAAAVRARLARLPMDLKETLAAAAVYGDIFWLEGLAPMIDLDLERTQERLDRLISRGLVLRRPQSRYHGTTELEFAHAVIRSVVLSRKKRERRRSLEEAALRWLESVGETDEITLGHHAAQVGRPEDAARLYARAATRTLAQGAFHAAANLAEEGLRVLEGEAVSPTAFAALYDAAARTAELTDDLDAADEALERLLGLAIPEELRAETLDRRARLSLQGLRFEDAVAQAEAAHRLWNELGSAVGAAGARVTHAEALARLGDDRGALRGFLAVRPDLERGSAKGAMVRVALGLGRIAVGSGDHATAERRLREAMAHARAAHDADGLFLAYLGLAEVARLMGDAERTEELLESAQSLAVRPEQERAVQLQRALGDAEAGQVARAQRALREVVARSRPPAGSVELWREGVLRAAQIVVGFGDEPGLERTVVRGLIRDAERALAHCDAESPTLRLPLEGALAYLLALIGDLDPAARMAERVVEQLDRDGVVHGDEAPRLYYALAKCFLRIGASTADVARVVRKAVEQLDTVASRLERDARPRFLARPIARRILDAADRSGLVVERDAAAHRLSIRA